MRKFDYSILKYRIWNNEILSYVSQIDEFSDCYSNKLKVAAILWKEVRNSINEKVYSRELLKKYEYKVEEYCK